MIKTYKDIEYTVIQSERKTASIHIERDGKISIIVPSKLNSRQIENILEESCRMGRTEFWQSES